jgi:hypothetical protein
VFIVSRFNSPSANAEFGKTKYNTSCSTLALRARRSLLHRASNRVGTSLLLKRFVNPDAGLADLVEWTKIAA